MHESLSGLASLVRNLFSIIYNQGFALTDTIRGILKTQVQQINDRHISTITEIGKNAKNIKRDFYWLTANVLHTVMP